MAYAFTKPGKYSKRSARNRFVTPRALSRSSTAAPEQAGLAAYLLKAKQKPGCEDDVLWARRWFRLSELSLEFSLTRATPTTGWLPASNIVSVEAAKEHGLGAFRVTSEPAPAHRTSLLLRAASSSDRDAWITAIIEASASKAPRLVSKKPRLPTEVAEPGEHLLGAEIAQCDGGADKGFEGNDGALCEDWELCTNNADGSSPACVARVPPALPAELAPNVTSALVQRFQIAGSALLH